MPFTLLLGGARSGKSSLAVELAQRSGRPVTFIATGEARDEEMAGRITRHRADRPAGWTVIEEPVAVQEALLALPAADFVVLDCLTLWVSNLRLRGEADRRVVEAATCVAGHLAERASGAVVVSNEVGLGIVPATELARSFRDTLGTVNAVFAGRAERAVLLLAGRVLELATVNDFMRT
jgi:adenosyl cobinamide kinase/adenosyl cobinamide phosphate guanylyltransferase